MCSLLKPVRSVWECDSKTGCQSKKSRQITGLDTKPRGREEGRAVRVRRRNSQLEKGSEGWELKGRQAAQINLRVWALPPQAFFYVLEFLWRSQFSFRIIFFRSKNNGRKLRKCKRLHKQTRMDFVNPLMVSHRLSLNRTWPALNNFKNVFLYPKFIE